MDGYQNAATQHALGGIAFCVSIIAGDICGGIFLSMKRSRPLQRDPGIENRLWLRLKALEGCRIRRGGTYRTFRLAFVEHEALLVVELDDGRRSAVRDRLLREAGYTILRFPRADALQNLPSVVATIRAVLQDRAHDN